MEKETLSNREMRRYSKQIMIPEIGISGQEKLKKANVLVIGAGGLGCPVLQYLSAAGTGRISIIDFDMVEEISLARQVLYGSSDLGKLKSIIAKSRLEFMNPLCEYKVINLKLDGTNSLGFFKSYDVIVDATDNPETRYIINDACVMSGKPMVHGAIYKFEGLVTVFNYKGGPSYRDLNPSDFKRAYRNPSPEAVGFFGVLPGITGTYMANEVIKIITGAGEVLSGRIMVFNIFENTSSILSMSNAVEPAEIPDMSLAAV